MSETERVAGADRCAGPAWVGVFLRSERRAGVETGSRTWVRVLFGPALGLIGFFFRSYRANRDRVAALMARPWAGALFKNIVVVTVILWLLIWLFAPEESRNQLSEAVSEYLGGLGSSPE